MVRIQRALVVLQMATHAGRTGQVVIVVDVAIGALARRDGVPSSEREAGRAVIELGVEPGVETVAGFARRWEICRDVIRIGRLLKIAQVA